MKKIISVFLTAALCVLTLAACGKQANPITSAQPADNSTADFPHGETSVGTFPQTQDGNLLELLYDTAENALCLYNFSAGAKVASYPIESSQRVVLMKKCDSGVVLLTSANNAGQVGEFEQEGSGSGIEFSGGYNAEAVDTFTLRRFDNRLNLLSDSKITDEKAVELIKNGLPSITTDGGALVILAHDRIIQYTLADGSMRETALELPGTVDFILSALSEDNSTLFYAGDGQDGTAYGAIDMTSGKGTLFTAKDFDLSSISVSGQYAVIRKVTPPQAAGTPGRVLLVSAAEGREIKLKDENENGLAVVTADGKAIVTCMSDRETGGILRCYNAQSGELVSEKPFDMGVACRTYETFVDAKNGYAVMFTGDGYLLSPPIAFQ